MTNQTLVAGAVGVGLGGLAGYLVGQSLLKKTLGPDSPELLAILGGIAGAVLVPAIVNAVPQPTPLANNAPTNAQTSSAQGTVPVFVPGA